MLTYILIRWEPPGGAPKEVIMSDAQKIQPFSLKDVPSGMEWCVSDKERRRGSVLCYPTAYKLVLALRWILSHTEEDYYGTSYDSWKVHWKMDDEYGFGTRIFLVRDKVEGYDPEREACYVAQKPASCQLARLICSNGNGVIDGVAMPNYGPYASRQWAHVDALTGVERLLQDATYGSEATHNYGPAIRFSDETRVLRNEGGRVEYLCYSAQTARMGYAGYVADL